MSFMPGYPPAGPGTIGPKGMRKRFIRLRDLAGIQTWPRNAMRHSFATYHLAHFQDIAKTAFELGHRSPDMQYLHYRNLVTHDAGQKWFAITP